jgi:hypothetical protein
METLKTECPNELRNTLRQIVCWSCDGAKGSGETCDWRHNGEFCDVVEPTVDAIHEAYYDYQMKELRKLK